MSARRLLFSLVAALVISILVTSFFYARFKRQQASSRPLTKRVVAAATGLQPGTAVKADELTEIDWPENVPVQGLIQKKEDVVGHMLMYAVTANEPLLQHDFASSGSFGLAARIPDGMRAIAIKTNETTDVAGFIFPGAHVDVLVTLRNGFGGGTSTVTRTALQNVLVLSTGAKTDPDPNGKPENVEVITLLVSPEQSEKLALAQNQAAQNQGTIHFVLRNGGDPTRPDTAPVDLAEFMGAQQPATPQKVTRHTAAAKPPSLYTVETVIGNKVTVAKFPLMPE
jgi:pilus assembly protein CpaB